MKIFKIAIISIVCVFLIGAICGIVNMQIKYPNPNEHYYSLNEAFSFDSCEITVKNCESWDLNSFCSEYDINNFLINITETENIHMCMVTVDVKNTGTEPIKPELYQMYLGDLACTTGLDLSFYLALNNDSSEMLNPSIDPGDTVTVELPFTMYGTTWGYSDGDFLNLIDLELTVALYPDKYVVKLNTN